MRIAVVTTSFPRTDDDPSGHFVLASARALARAGHEVHVVAPGGSPFQAPERRGVITLHPAGGGELFGWPGAAARAREAPWRLFQALPFALGVLGRFRRIGPVDRAVAHWIVPSAWPLATALDVPLDVVAHGADVRALIRAPAPLRHHVVGALLAREAHFTFAARSALGALAAELSPALADALRRVSRIEPPAIDVPDVAARAAELRASLGLARGERVALAASRLVGSKRVELAIDAVGAATSPIRLVVVGDGPERAALERRAAERAVPVAFTGILPRREALAWVASADVLVHPSAVEAAPTVVREARALGTRVVACDSGDVAAWAASDTGITIVDPRPDAIARALEPLLGSER